MSLNVAKVEGQMNEEKNRTFTILDFSETFSSNMWRWAIIPKHVCGKLHLRSVLGS